MSRYCNFVKVTLGLSVWYVYPYIRAEFIPKIIKPKRV